jgi:hypothetical protein
MVASLGWFSKMPFLHDFHYCVLNFLRHAFQLRRLEHPQQSGWLQGGQNGFAAFLEKGTIIFWTL